MFLHFSRPSPELSHTDEKPLPPPTSKGIAGEEGMEEGEEEGGRRGEDAGGKPLPIH